MDVQSEEEEESVKVTFTPPAIHQEVSRQESRQPKKPPAFQNKGGAESKRSTNMKGTFRLIWPRRASG